MWAEPPNCHYNSSLPPLEHLVRMLQWSSLPQRNIFSQAACACVFVLLCRQFGGAQTRTLQSINIINTVLFPFSRLFWSNSPLRMSIKAPQADSPPSTSTAHKAPPLFLLVIKHRRVDLRWQTLLCTVDHRRLFHQTLSCLSLHSSESKQQAVGKF